MPKNREKQSMTLVWNSEGNSYIARQIRGNYPDQINLKTRSNWTNKKVLLWKKP